MIRTLGTTGHLAASSSAVLRRMALVAECDQVVFSVGTGVTANLLVVALLSSHVVYLGPHLFARWNRFHPQIVGKDRNNLSRADRLCNCVCALHLPWTWPPW